MERYQLLQTIYDISKVDPKPETYPCRPRELILRLMQDWSVIQQHLNILEEEGLIRTVQQDTLIIYLSPEGIQKLVELKAISLND
jgi:DNA-binding transcriptional ArsR family regulator